MKKPSMVELTAEEQALLDKIVFDPSGQDGSFYEILRQSCKASADLARSLLSRKAIPDIRLQYFNNPDFNIGKTKKSRQQVFESNGTSGDAILEHPHFLKYLKYFVFGPDLPQDAIDEFYDAVVSAVYISGGDMPMLWQKARDATRRHHVDSKHASEEYYKLALECGISEMYARSIRDHVRKI